jgi:hypothetical protein
MIASHNWIKFRSYTRPVDGINMDRLTAFLPAAPGPECAILLYLGWTAESKNPWVILWEEDAEAVIQELAACGLIDSVAVGTSS